MISPLASWLVLVTVGFGFVVVGVYLWRWEPKRPPEPEHDPTIEELLASVREPWIDPEHPSGRIEVRPLGDPEDHVIVRRPPYDRTTEEDPI